MMLSVNGRTKISTCKLKTIVKKELQVSQNLIYKYNTKAKPRRQIEHKEE